ncbi:MAG TPA: right-handed parallel beta-helix repeat-containing protein [Polyangiales bacterium]|nr:right-handed parallel beta-helix repeat-containing protein [Polyangiales bacterium]
MKKYSRAVHSCAGYGLACLLCLVQLACSKSDAGTTAADPSLAAGVGAAGAAAVGGAGSPGTPAGGIGGAAGRSASGTSGASGATAAGATAAAGSSGVAGGTSAAGAGTPAMVPPAAGAAAGGGAGAPAAIGDNDLWVAPSGVDTNPGTEAMPLAGLAAAVERIQAGGTIWIAAGTYKFSQTVPITRSGEDSKPMRIFAQAGERPIFDFMGQPRGSSSARGIQISGNYWHLRGVDVINAGDNCIHISGSHNTIERVVTHGCSDSGIQITANSSDAADATRAANNTVINCDSYENYDEANSGENADGFAAKLYIGPGNVFRGCRAWNNADDGWDLFASDDVVVIENCWAISNGKIGPSQNNTNGDGNGFKLGGAAQAGDQNMGGAVHQVKNCVSFENRACGYTRNNNTQVPQLSMCGGRGDGKGLLCSLTSSGGAVSVSMTAAEAIAAKRDADGNLPAVR